MIQSWNSILYLWQMKSDLVKQLKYVLVQQLYDNETNGKT